jgi:4-carboxymuconolactone decarboxylase
MTPAPRIPPLPREEWTDASRDVFALLEGTAARETGSRSNTIMTLAQHPDLAVASLNFGKYVLGKSSLNVRQRELIVLRVAARYASPYQWAHHVIIAGRIGMGDAEFGALRSGGVSPLWNRDDQAIVSATDQLFDSGRIDDATWAILGETMDRRQRMDFLYTVGFFTMNAWALGNMGVEVEPELQSPAS